MSDWYHVDLGDKIEVSSVIVISVASRFELNHELSSENHLIDITHMVHAYLNVQIQCYLL